MAAYRYFFWRKAPFIKLLPAFVAGIILQYYYDLSLRFSCILFATTAAAWFLLGALSLFRRYTLGFYNGLLISILFFSLGSSLSWLKDIHHDHRWFGHLYKDQDAIIAVLNEPLTEKPNSVKAEAKVNRVLKGDTSIPARGKIIIYFEKNLSSGSFNSLNYGSTIIFKKKIQEIRNSGNPGSFDYRQYCSFNGITHQVYLKKEEFKILPAKKEKRLTKFLYSSREWVLRVLKENIPSAKERGLAEALLIGYKGDLEQSLVQSYTNTGVVHIIAISGLHLGIIYGLLLLVFKPLQKNNTGRWLSAVFIISGLWLFTLLAGAQPSVLRSAVMFTCIIIAKTLNRPSSLYNTLAASAFLLLCIHPYWLWDVGFQLSFAAVLSIVIFMQPIYNWFYFKNKALDFIWKMNAVTLAAQILTLPLSIYHFHQFPSWFLLTNFIAVPLSGIILLGEIFLCTLSFIPPIALFTGKILCWLIGFMNTYIEKVETLPLSLWQGLQITILQSIILFVCIAGIGWWTMERSKPGLIIALWSLLLFTCLRSWSFIRADQQQKIIVYNVPGKRAIDFIQGREYFFTGDSSLLQNGFAQNFHLKPSRMLHRIKPGARNPIIRAGSNYIIWQNKHILLLTEDLSYSSLPQRSRIDLLVLSGKAPVHFHKLAGSLDIRQVVFDGTVPAWKIKNSKRDCDSLQIPWHDVRTSGAFVLN